jgi:hypothetical protein
LIISKTTSLKSIEIVLADAALKFPLVGAGLISTLVGAGFRRAFHEESSKTSKKKGFKAILLWWANPHLQLLTDKIEKGR